MSQLRPLAPIAGAHHEWMNGAGYDRGLEGAALPLGARILAIADEFQDLTEARLYPKGMAEKAGRERGRWYTG